ncbi:MAG: BlaI/MecI/CopY family transcriptional regulator [Thaumarchaeota archaeon]|jgi:predicted transcriptional regulator|nr:BlaI/MecI/CopY family transcriptional regulator [Nitrososphaerota archaeon]
MLRTIVRRMRRGTAKISQYNIEGKELQAFLGPLETSIIEVMWSSKQPLTVRDVYEKLRRRKRIAYTTVMTTMDRLYEKGLLDRRMEKGRGGVLYVYWPKFEEHSFKKSAVHEVLNSLVENFGDIVASYLVERLSSDEKEFKELKEKLEKALKGKGG